jgi:hypothetical protein
LSLMQDPLGLQPYPALAVSLWTQGRLGSRGTTLGAVVPHAFWILIDYRLATRLRSRKWIDDSLRIAFPFISSHLLSGILLDSHSHHLLFSHRFSCCQDTDFP